MMPSASALTSPELFVLKIAEGLQRAYEAKISDDNDAVVVTAQQADLKISEAITVVRDLMLHAVVIVFANENADGTRTALRISVVKDGLIPPM